MEGAGEAEERTLRIFYRHCRDYHIHLKRKRFDEWFTKYYQLLKDSRDGGLILDAGCGAGQVVNRLTEEGKKASGFDISVKAIRLAHRSRSGERKASFLVADCYNLPFREASFSVVGCMNLLEHLLNPRGFLMEAQRALEPHGTLIINSPNLLSPIYKMKLKRKISTTRRLLLKLLSKKRRRRFVRAPPIIDWSGRRVGEDLDAITLIDPVTLKEKLKEVGFKVEYHSFWRKKSNSILEWLSRLPLLRSFGGEIVIKAKKKARESSERGE